MNKSLFYTYGTLAHGILTSSYIQKINNNNREKILYLLAHLFITSAMLIRINPSLQYHIIPYILGTIGHFLLFLFFTLITFVLHHKYRIAFSHNLYYLNLSCILGQIGMILIYWLEYFEKQLIRNNKLMTLKFAHYLKITVFSILALFYLSVAFKSDNKFSSIFLGLLLISGLYIFSLLQTLKSNENVDKLP